MHTKQRASVDTSNLQERVEGQKALLEETAKQRKELRARRRCLKRRQTCRKELRARRRCLKRRQSKRTDQIDARSSAFTWWFHSCTRRACDSSSLLRHATGSPVLGSTPASTICSITSCSRASSKLRVVKCFEYVGFVGASGQGKRDRGREK
jgi:hypothetical protein